MWSHRVEIMKRSFFLPIRMERFGPGEWEKVQKLVRSSGFEKSQFRRIYCAIYIFFNKSWAYFSVPLDKEAVTRAFFDRLGCIDPYYVIWISLYYLGRGVCMQSMLLFFFFSLSLLVWNEPNVIQGKFSFHLLYSSQTPWTDKKM